MYPATVNQTDSATFLRTLDRSLREHKESGSPLGLVVANVENLDQLRSVFGYSAAMPFLAAVAEKLRTILGAEDTVIRFGEAKFGILIGALKNEGHLVLAVTKILRTVTRGFDIGGESLEAKMRIGATSSHGRGGDPDAMLQQAETALLAARQDDQDFLIYESGQTTRLRSALGLAKELEAALDNGEITMFYQPKVAAADRSPVGAEALMRWSSPTRGFVAPDVFIPIADKTGHIEPLTYFALNAALRQRGEWPDLGRPLSVAVNVTPSLVEQADLEDLVSSAQGLWDVPADQVTIEVTENALMRPETSFATLAALRKIGVRVSIDDFGTGYSSFSYFKSLPADELKIDKSFVMQMLDDDGYERIVRTIINLAHGFGLRVTAEGVEDEQTAAALASLDCDYLQGYFFSRPLPQDEFIAWLRDHQP